MDKRTNNRLYELRKKRKTSQIAVGLATNISQSRISTYERGEPIPSDMLILLANYYKVSTDYILMRTDDIICKSNIQLSVEEIELISLYRQLSQNNKELFNGMILLFKNTLDEK